MITTMTNSEKHTGEVAGPENTYQKAFTPHFDIWEDDDELLLYGDLPGVSSDDLDIRFENRELTIHGKAFPRHKCGT